MTNRLKLIPIIAGALILLACTDKPQDEEATEPALTPDLLAGKQVVEGTCIKCHGQGLNGAPILGNKKMWGKRLPQGEDTLVDHAINGYAMDMMPAKGGNPDLSDEDIRMAVRYMMSLVQ